MQSKTASMVETCCDIGTGFLIAWGVYLWVILPYVPRDAAFTITCIFTVVSLGRRYLWRRFFATGLHAVVWARVKKQRSVAPAQHIDDEGPTPW